MNNHTTVTDQVRSLYDNIGWTSVGEVTYDAHTLEDLRPVAADYVSACHLRVLRHLPEGGDRILDMASGPIQYPEYLRYSQGFKTRVCVDLSERAIEIAKARIGDHGEFHVGDFLELTIAPVDAAISLHTIYHIHKSRQEEAVRKLINLTKSGGTVVIVYSNPNRLLSYALTPLRKIANILRRRNLELDDPRSIYFHRFPLSWWKRFNDTGTVAMFPWRTFSSPEMRKLFPNNSFGRRMLAGLFALEGKFPKFFATIGCYQIIVIQKSV